MHDAFPFFPPQKKKKKILIWSVLNLLDDELARSSSFRRLDANIRLLPSPNIRSPKGILEGGRVAGGRVLGRSETSVPGAG